MNAGENGEQSESWEVGVATVETEGQTGILTTLPTRREREGNAECLS